MKLITMGALAKQLGIDRSTVNKSARNGFLRGTKVGVKIDLDNEKTQRFIKAQALAKVAKEKRDILNPPAKKNKRPGRPKVTVQPEEEPQKIEASREVDLEEIPEDVRKLADKSLRELLKIFGTASSMDSWLKNAKGLEDLHEKKLKNRATEGKLIPREFVEKHIFGFLDGIFNRLLNDSPKTISSKAVELVEAGEPRENIQTMILDNISSQIKASKTRIKKSIKNV